MANVLFLIAGIVLFVHHWDCCCGQILASAYRLERSDNISVVGNVKGDTAMGPFAGYREPAAGHQWSRSKVFQEDPAAARIRRDNAAPSGKGRTVDDNDNRILVQTLNGVVRGTKKTALDEAVDVFLGVSDEDLFFFPSRLVFFCIHSKCQSLWRRRLVLIQAFPH